MVWAYGDLMTLSLLAAHQAATDLLNCVCQSLVDMNTEIPGLAGCPCRVYVSPGSPAADGCDGGCNVPPGTFPGQLTTHVVRLYASDRQSFPNEVGTRLSGPTGIHDLKNCAMPQTTAVELMITLWRCTPLPTDQGCPPTPEELTDSAMQLNADLLAVQRGVLCCFSGTDTTQRHGRRWVMGQTTVLGPQGGCAGFQTSIVVALDDQICCNETPLAGPEGV